MDRAMDFEVEEVLSDLELLLHCLHARIRPHTSALPSAPTRRRRTTRIRSRPSRLARPYPRPASTPAPVGLLAPRLEGLPAATAMGVAHDQPPEARRGQFEFATPPPPSVVRGVPPSAGGIILPTRPPTPVRRETAVATHEVPSSAGGTVLPIRPSLVLVVLDVLD